MLEVFESAGSPLNLPVLQSAVRWLEAGQVIWLCTVLQTFGSSPRPAGTMLALAANGEWAGSVSGGCIEADLLVRLKDETAGPAGPSGPAGPDLVRCERYGTTEDDRRRFQLPCGGQMVLMIERRAPSPENIGHFGQLVESLQVATAVARRVTPATAACSLSDHADQPGIRCDGRTVTHVLAPQCRLLLVGAGEVAREVSRLALRLDFAVTLCDPREDWIRDWQEPGVEVVRLLPDDLIRDRFQDDRVAILALAHDPRVDDLALVEALRSQAFLVGAMGSLRTSAQRRERLHALGLYREEIARLHAPVGFDIGSKTPAEIAVAIAAQLVAERFRLFRRGPVRQAPMGRRTVMQDAAGA